jgi:urocanate hydratase
MGHVFCILVLAFRWVCASGKPEDLKQILSACGTGRNGKTALLKFKQMQG